MDQENLPTNTALNAFIGTNLWQQEVIAGIAGQLVGVEYFIPQNGAAADSRHHFGISVGEPWHWEESDWTSIQTVNFPEDFIDSKYVDVSAADILLEVGDAITLRWTEFAPGVGTNLQGSSGNNYPGNLYWRNSAEQQLPELWSSDFAFRTWIETDPTGIPEPSGMVLLILAMVCGSQIKRYQQTRR